jgi:hypothetical protein
MLGVSPVGDWHFIVCYQRVIFFGIILNWPSFGAAFSWGESKMKTPWQFQTATEVREWHEELLTVEMITEEMAAWDRSLHAGPTEADRKHAADLRRGP